MAARNDSCAMSSAAAGVVHDEKGRAVGPRPVQPEERLDSRSGPSLRRAHGGALLAAGGHPLTLRPPPRERSIVTGA